MAEAGETPQESPQQEVQQIPLEDRPEFKRLSPELQERVLAYREKLMQEAGNPREVVTRSIDEMGFWEGLWNTAKPHLKEKKTIMFKDLKAKASLALSLVPLLGEGLSFGKGILGFYKAEKGIAKFEPAVRLVKAGKAIGTEAKATWEAGKAFQKIAKPENAKLVSRVVDKTGRAAEWVTRPIRAIWSGGTAPMSVLNAEYSAHAAGVAEKMLAGNKMREMQQGLQKSAQEAHGAYVAKKMTEAASVGVNLKDAYWWDLPKQWKKFQVNRGAGAEAKRVLRTGKKMIDAKLEADLAGTGAGVLASEAYKVTQKAKPTVLEGLGLKKYLGLLDHWLNLTPDVPVWLSTTTAVGEFVGMHGIDAIPAVIQLGKNKMKDAGVTFNMAKDVWKFTKKRLFDTNSAPKQAAEVFTPAQTVT